MHRTRRRGPRWIRVGPFGVLLLLGLSPSPAAAKTPLPTLAVIAHPKRKSVPDSDESLRRLFLKRETRWANGDPVVVLNLPARTPLRVAFDRAVLALSPTAAARYWIDVKVRGRGQPPRSVASQAVIGRIVAARTEAIGYVRLDAVRSGVRVLAIIEAKTGKLRWRKPDG